ncbi:MAG: hypothetical protein QOE14_2638, partial [Humisphaera sp.]|nr:hypothetical protein [Humisphaera sp.]
PRLVLRGGRDQEVNATVGVSMADLKGGNGRLDPVTTVAIAPPTTTPTQVIAVTPPPKTVRSTVAAVPRRMVRVIRAGRVSVVSLAAQEQVPSNGTDFGPSEEMPEDAVGTIDIFGK